MNETTELPERFEIGDGHAIHRPEGNVSFHEAGELLSRSIVYCRENGIRRLLLDTTKVTGFGPIGTAPCLEAGAEFYLSKTTDLPLLAGILSDLARER